MSKLTPLHNTDKIQYDVVFEQASIGIVIVDSTGAIIKVNSFLLNLFGYSDTELLGKKIEILIPQRFNHSHQSHRNQYLKNPKNIDSPYMTIGFDTVNGKEKIPAAIHSADSTVRPMILKQDYNPKIWELVYLFYKKTGIPVLLNTSFNLHGEPLVESLDDAIDTVNRSEIDYIYIP